MIPLQDINHLGTELFGLRLRPATTARFIG
jgi:hypothetical protein